VRFDSTIVQERIVAEKGAAGGSPDQIEYDDEDPSIRRMFEAELAKLGTKSRMDPEVYKKWIC
jgi:hypothetical protein